MIDLTKTEDECTHINADGTSAIGPTNDPAWYRCNLCGDDSFPGLPDDHIPATPLDRKELDAGDLLQHGQIGNVFRVKKIHPDGAIEVETIISVNDQRHGYWRKASEDAPIPGARVHMNGDRVLVLNESPMWTLPAMEIDDEPFGVTIRTFDEEFMILRRPSDADRVRKYEKKHDMTSSILGEPGHVTGIYPLKLMDEISIMLTGMPQKKTTAPKTWCIWQTGHGMTRDPREL